MEHQSEVELVYQVITHPAGFDIGNTGTLTIRPLEDDTWAVSWENYFNPPNFRVSVYDDLTDWQELIIPNALQAAQCFVELRHKLLIGLDLEAQEEPHIKPYYRLNDEEINELEARYNAK